MMKQNWRRFAPFALYLSGIATVAALVLYIIQREWNLYLQICLGLVAIGMALFAIMDPEKVRIALTGRQARYGSNTLVMSLAFLGILVVINYLVYQNSKRWDLTEDKINTLAPETLETLNSLKAPVEAQAFFTSRTSPEYAQGLLEQYKFSADGKFDYQFIDPEADPIAAQNANITRDGSIIVRMGDRQEAVSFVSEKEMTAALVRLISEENVRVYFLTGHGERDPQGTDENAYSQVKSTLEGKNYQVESLNLLSTHKLPEDAKVIVIAGPRVPLTDEEVDLLQVHLETGGSMIVMEEPLPMTEFEDQEDPLARYLYESFGITLGKDLVVDLTSQQPFVAVANQYGEHVITEKLQGMVSYFPTARSVQSTQEMPGFSQIELVFTANQSWAETDLAGLGEANAQVQPDEGVDLMGPVPLAALIESEANNQRIVVFGDVDFATNSNFGQFGNGDLLINAIDWAAEQENLINLTPKEPTQRVLVPPQRYTQGLILFGSVFLLPGIVLVAGIVVWINRRRRG